MTALLPIRLLLVVCGTLLGSTNTVSAGWTSESGDFSLDVAYRQVEDGKPATTVVMLSLACIDSRCKLETLTLNQCFDTLGQRPKSEVSFNVPATWYGPPRLTVTRSDNVILATERIPGGALSYRFVISPDRTVTGETGKVVPIKAVEFSGALDKYSDILKRQLAVSLVRVPSGQVSAACPFNVE